MQKRGKIKMKKKVTGAAAVLLSAAITAGCGNEIPELNEQQQELVVEYAASQLLKYDANHEEKLVELTLEEEAVPEEGGEEAAMEEEVNTEEEIQDVPDTEDVPVIDNTQEQQYENVSIEEFLNLSSVRMTYTGYETSSVYPEQGEEFYFVMNATEGNELLILKFLAENLSGTEMPLDISQSGTRFKISLNGQEKNALTTMLVNDLAYFQGTLSPAEGTELVLICEIPREEVSGIASLGVIMKNGDRIAAVPLF